MSSHRWEATALSRLKVVRTVLAGDPRARGRVLDAGTGGGHMTALLAGLRPAELLSVSLDETSFPEARLRLPPGTDERVRFVLTDLAGDDLAPELGPGRSYDLVVGDYLLAAVAGHRPFREVDVLARLASLLAPGGLLVVTGLEPFDPPAGPEQEAVWTVHRWWSALTYLGGEEMYREVPSWWVSDRLRERGLAVSPPLWSEPVLWSLGQLREMAADSLARVEGSTDGRLSAYARRHLEAVIARAARLPGLAGGKGRVAYGRDWVVLAEPGGRQAIPGRPEERAGHGGKARVK